MSKVNLMIRTVPTFYGNNNNKRFRMSKNLIVSPNKIQTLKDIIRMTLNQWSLINPIHQIHHLLFNNKFYSNNNYNKGI